ncbi:hypothetical protein Tco_1429554 [Tanacetum coccineum]
MWYYCRMHRIRMRHTTDSGVAAAGLRRTTTSGIVGGSLGIGHGIGSITLHESKTKFMCFLCEGFSSKSSLHFISASFESISAMEDIGVSDGIDNWLYTCGGNSRVGRNDFGRREVVVSGSR